MKRTIPVVGMACAACSANVERRLSSLPGVNSASVSLAGRSALIDYDPSVISLKQMKEQINDIGYDLVIEEGRSVAAIERRAYTMLRRRTLLSWILSLFVMAVSMHWIDVGQSDSLWAQILHLGLEATAPPHGQYGFARSALHRHCFSLLGFQYLFWRGCMGRTRH